MAKLTSFRPAELRRVVETGVEEVTERVLREAVRTCPVGSGGGAGALRASLKKDVRSRAGEVVGTVYTDVSYAPYVHEGRGPVVARPGRVLGPLPGPYPRFVRRVAAAKAQPWLLEALQSAQPYPVRTD